MRRRDVSASVARAPIGAQAQGHPEAGRCGPFVVKFRA